MYIKNLILIVVLLFCLTGCQSNSSKNKDYGLAVNITHEPDIPAVDTNLSVNVWLQNNEKQPICYEVILPDLEMDVSAVDHDSQSRALLVDALKNGHFEYSEMWPVRMESNHAPKSFTIPPEGRMLLHTYLMTPIKSETVSFRAKYKIAIVVSNKNKRIIDLVSSDYSVTILCKK